MTSIARHYAVPASFFGMVLGIVGLANAWRRAAQVWGLPVFVSDILTVIGLTVWAVLVVLFAAKWLFNRQQAIGEALHPVQCCFVGLAGVSTMLVAGALLPHARSVAEPLFWVGALFTLGFGVWRTGLLWRGGREEAATTAVLYLPTVAGSFVAANALVVFGYGADWGQLAFGAGLFSWLALESVLLHRLLCAPTLAAAVRPTLGVQLAPPTVGCVAYLSVTSGVPDTVAHAMLGYGLLQALVLLRNARWFAEQAFAAGYWAFSFGLTALALAPLTMVSRGSAGATAQIAPVLFALANVGVVALALGTLRLLVDGRLLAAMRVAAPTVPGTKAVT